MRYNCTIIDLFDRSVGASVTGKNIKSQLVAKTLDIALNNDQGSQFTSKEFTEFCKSNDVIQSMSHAGCPYDNAPMERYFNKLKNELIYHHYYRSEEQLYMAVSD